jgi:hypothetical protein
MAGLLAYILRELRPLDFASSNYIIIYHSIIFFRLILFHTHPQLCFSRSCIGVVGQACSMSVYFKTSRRACCSVSSVKRSPPVLASCQHVYCGFDECKNDYYEASRSNDLHIAIAMQAVFIAGGARRFEIAIPQRRFTVLITSA